MKTLLHLCFVTTALMTISLVALGQETTPVSTTTSTTSTAPHPAGEKYISMLRMDLRSEKKKIIALNVPLTDVEATKFWPVYDQYVAEMTKHNDAFYALIRNYSENRMTWTDAQSLTFLDQWSKLQIEQAKTRQKYVPLVEKVIPAKKAAIFFQVDRRLYLLMDLQVSTHLPLLTE